LGLQPAANSFSQPFLLWRYRRKFCAMFYVIGLVFELELELIQTQMTQKPMLRAEVYARALRASQNRKEESV
jgi:hypothetical protein